MSWLKIICCALPLWLAIGVSAQPPAPGAGPAAASAAALQAPPPVPTNKSPVTVFRELLAMTDEERRLALSNRPPETRKLILTKVRSYQSLKPDVRELRLQATELRWYLMPLLQTPPTNRPAQLSLIPTNFQHLVRKRIEIWDKVPPADQSMLLKNEAILRYMTEVATPEELSEKRRQMLEEGIVEWQARSEDDKNKIKKRFDQFFTLDAEEQSKALNTLSEAERQQIEKTLTNYAKLSPAQRAQCIGSFEKFANLSLEERQQFLKNAERWKLMSPAERKAWRDLVSRLQTQPPAPPGMNAPPPPPAQRRSPGTVAGTNG
jgi:hypothetical protein